MLIDSHCHLDHEKMAAHPEEVIKRAGVAGVRHIVTIVTRLENLARVKAITSAHKNVSMAIGVHPHSAANAAIKSEKDLLELVDDPDVVGIGETGLDYFYNYCPVEDQKRIFEFHIDAAREADLPLIVHTRDAEQNTIDILAQAKRKGDFRCLIHCFTGSQWFADACRDLDCYFSASGVVTFKKSEQLRQTFTTLPQERILLETDSPFLAPTPYRGKPNEPAYVQYTATVMAEVLGLQISDLITKTGENFQRLFSKVKIETGNGQL